VEMVGTTDDPLDSLEDHLKIRNDESKVKVLPTFRPDRIFNIDSGNKFRNYVQKLGELTHIKITDLESLLNAFKIRINYFNDAGCVSSDHGLSAIPHKGKN